MASLLSPLNPRRRSALGSIDGNALASSADKPYGRSAKEWALILGSSKASSSSSSASGKKKAPEEKAFSGEFFGRRGIFSRKRGPTPSLVTAFGVSGILEDAPGKPPAVVKAMGEEGVLQETRGPTPAAVLAAQAAQAEVARSKAGRKKASRERAAQEEAAAAAARSAADFPTDGSTRWTKTVVSGLQSADLPVDPLFDPERWTMEDVAGIGGARARAAAATTAAATTAAATTAAATTTSTTPRRTLPTPPPGYPPLEVSTPDVAAQLADEVRAERMRAEMATPDGATAQAASADATASASATSVSATSASAQGQGRLGADARVGQRQPAVKAKRLLKTPMANKKATVLTSMAMQEQSVEESPPQSTAATRVKSSSEAFTPAVDVSDGAASASEGFPCVRASYAPKTMASDWGRLFKAKPAREASDAAPDVDPIMEPPGTPPGKGGARAELPAKKPPPPPPLQAEAEAEAEAEAKALTEREVKAMKVIELRGALQVRGLQTEGLKPTLTARLLASIASGAPAVEEAAPADGDDAADPSLLESVKNIIAQAVSASPAEGEAPARRTMRASARGKEN